MNIEIEWMNIYQIFKILFDFLDLLPNIFTRKTLKKFESKSWKTLKNYKN